jgi:glycosyltransferase involved in cell wall biosynthesis
MRGFDIFMRVARRIYEEYPDTLFVVVGADQTYYGGDERYIQHATFKEHVLSQDDYDLSRFCFTGQISTKQLVEILSISDMHIYLSVPFVLSWSVFNALACECVVLASDTAPVRELINSGENGLLVDFHDVEGLASNALRVLRDPTMYRSMGTRGAELIREQYNLESSLVRLTSLYRRVCGETTSAVTS